MYFKWKELNQLDEESRTEKKKVWNQSYFCYVDCVFCFLRDTLLVQNKKEEPNEGILGRKGGRGTINEKRKEDLKLERTIRWNWGKTIRLTKQAETNILGKVKEKKNKV